MLSDCILLPEVSLVAVLSFSAIPAAQYVGGTSKQQAQLVTSLP
jgi:hypothetical protein